jgi:hypothetical protein
MTNETMNAKSNKWVTAAAVIAGIALVLGTAGCKGTGEKAQVSHGEQFYDEDAPRGVNKFADAQISSGARADSTLYAYHFDGAQLNSLGRQKLRYMAKDDDACEPLVVYLDVKNDSDVKARHDAVGAFLMDEVGLLQTQMALKDGPNPNYGSSAVKGLKALAASENVAAPAPAPAPTAASASTSGK